MSTSRPDRTTLAAFCGAVLIGGTNMVAVRVSDRGLEPFWGATLRFAIAAAVMLVIVRARGLPFPHGRALRFAIVYGILTFGASFALFYWGVMRVPAGTAGVIMASTPLLALLLSVLHGLEPFRRRGAVGAGVALAGIAVIFAGRSGSGLPTASVLAILGSAACAAESATLLKRAPEVNPVTMNAVAMSIGAPILLALSLVDRETLAAPHGGSVWAAVLFMGLLGTPALFFLYVFVIHRWTVSASSFQFVLAPVVAIVLGALLLEERITPAILLGAPLVLAGVWIGALASEHRPAEVGAPPSDG
jgi:drug/metabolite transporter (DMT)-like permease